MHCCQITCLGVTLLAMGNGAADVFSAAAAVFATEEGGQLAVGVFCVCALSASGPHDYHFVFTPYLKMVAPLL